MEMMQVGFLVVGVFILWSSMNLTAPAPVTPNDVTGELNSMLEFIQKLRNRSTPLANSDRQKQAELDKIFDEAEQEIRSLLRDIEEKGRVIQDRTGTDQIEYEQGWSQLNENISEVMTTFQQGLSDIDWQFSEMKTVYSTLNQGQEQISQLNSSMVEQTRVTNENLKQILSLYI
ncbi:MAG: hypothetical protein L7S56_08310 [Candidatus Poseidonia sp.]|nr:hypothetical protein [Poseidonia sp.]